LDGFPRIFCWKSEHWIPDNGDITSECLVPVMESPMQHDTDFPQYATLPDIARRFRLSRSTVYRLIAQGAIEAVKVGRCTRIVTRSVEEHFAGLPRLRTAI